MAKINASEVERAISTVQDRNIWAFRNQLRYNTSRIIGNNQKLVVPRKEDTFRNGIERGLKPLEVANVTNVNLDTPFLIWAKPSNILVASHIQPRNSSAQIDYSVDSDTLSDDVERVSLSFYFQWENPSHNPVLLANVASRLSVNGRWDASAASALMDPYGNHTVIDADVALRIFEWWNQPPTTPSLDGRQFKFIVEMWVDGGTHITDGAGRNAFTTVFNSFDVNYPHSIVVPPKGVMVFEVALDTTIDMMGGYDTASIRVFGSNSSLVCPFVKFQVTENVVDKGPPLP